MTFLWNMAQGRLEAVNNLRSQLLDRADLGEYCRVAERTSCFLKLARHFAAELKERVVLRGESNQ